MQRRRGRGGLRLSAQFPRRRRGHGVADSGDHTPARWADLRRFTPARVALGRAGNGLPTAAHLDFQAAHAAARDAVHAALDVAALRADLDGGRTAEHRGAQRGARIGAPICCGPISGGACVRRIAPRFPSAPGAMLFVVCDGLSATAVQRHAVMLLRHVVPALLRTGQRLHRSSWPNRDASRSATTSARRWAPKRSPC